MKPAAEVGNRIDEVGRTLAEALGDAALCIGVYGSAAGDDFAAGHSDVNLVIVLSRVTFADLRLIGTTLEREAGDLLFATPLVITPSFLRDARDSFPIEIDDIGARHRVLHGEDLLGGLAVEQTHLRQEAEREARSELLRLRALVMHRPPEESLQRALSGLGATIGVIERALLRKSAAAQPLRGATLFAEVERRQGIRLSALARLHEMRDGSESWPTGDALDDLVAACLRDVETLVAWVDSHAQDSIGSEER